MPDAETSRSSNLTPFEKENLGKPYPRYNSSEAWQKLDDLERRIHILEEQIGYSPTTQASRTTLVDRLERLERRMSDQIPEAFP